MSGASQKSLFAQRLSSASVGAIALILASEAAAQTQPPPPPQPANVDANNVDVATRTLVLGATDLRIGPDDHRGLQLTRQVAAHSWRLTTTPVMSGSSSNPIIVIGGRSYAFSWNGSVYVPAIQNGSSLNSGATLFTASDGTVVQFQSVTSLTEHASAFKAASQITFPDGVKHTFTYKSGLYQLPTLPETFELVTRLISINSSTGYQLKFNYISNDPRNFGWRQLANVTSINNSVEYCNPTADNCSLIGDWPKVTFENGLTATTKVTSPEGRRTSYGYTSGKLVSINPANGTDVGSYITYAGDKVSTVERDGTWTYSNPQSGTTKVTNPQTFATNYAYSGAGYITSITNAKNEVTTFAYCTGTSTCPAGRVQRITSPEQNYSTFAYDPRGNVIATTAYSKPNQTLSPITRSASYPTSCTNPVTCNKPNHTIDAKGYVTNYSWDPTHGGLTQIQLPAPATGAPRPTKSYTYNTVQARYLTGDGVWSNSGPMYVPDVTRECRTSAVCTGSADERIEDLNYLPSSIANNALATSVTVKAGNNTLSQTTALTYTSLGDLQSVDGPLGGAADTTKAFYNKSRQLIGSIGSAGAGSTYPTQRITYDIGGKPWKVEYGYTSAQTETALDAMTIMRTSSTHFDGYSRPIRHYESGNTGVVFSVAQTGYDNMGRVTCSTQRMNPSTFNNLPLDACSLATTGLYGKDRVTKFSYDQLDRVTSVTQGFNTVDSANVLTRSFTANGLVKTLRDGINNLTTYEYDGLDRNVRVRFPIPTKGANTSSTADYEQYTFDANGNVLTFRTRRAETLTMSYDRLNRLISKVVPARSGLSTTHTRNVYYDYDLFGNLIKARFDSLTGEGVTAAYDGLGRLTGETLTMNGSTRTVGSGYDAANRRTTVSYPDNQVFSYTYEANGRPDLIKDPANNTLINYGFEANGRLSRIDRIGSSNEQFIGYDAASRMNSLSIDTSSTVPVNTATFAHNPASQIITSTKSKDSFVWNAHKDANRAYTVNGLNQYTAAGTVSFSYDANGNLSSDGTNSFVYDVENRLVYRSGNNTTATLRYDPLGRLFEVNGSDTGVTRFVYDRDALIAEFNSSGSMVQRHIHGPAIGFDDPLVTYAGASVATSNARMLYADERGSIIYSTSSVNTAPSINTYDPFGIPGATNTGRFQYTGQAWISEMGMYHYKARTYSPTLGRFMQSDPIGYGDGMNMYRYAANDPVNAIDPFGLASCDEYPGGWTEYYDTNKNGRLDDGDTIVRFVSCGGGGGESSPGAPNLPGQLPGGSGDGQPNDLNDPNPERNPKDECRLLESFSGFLSWQAGGFSTFTGVFSDALYVGGTVTLPWGGAAAYGPAAVLDAASLAFDGASLLGDLGAGNDITGKTFNAGMRAIPTVTIGQMAYSGKANADRPLPYRTAPESPRRCGPR